MFFGFIYVFCFLYFGHDAWVHMLHVSMHGCMMYVYIIIFLCMCVCMYVCLHAMYAYVCIYAYVRMGIRAASLGNVRRELLHGW